MNVTSIRHSINADTSSEDSCEEPLLEAIISSSSVKDGKFPKKRHVLGLLGFLGFANVYAMRVMNYL
jgi:hypothetical protein